MIDRCTPCPSQHLKNFIYKLKNKEPFSFVRFSDGEVEILRNRYLEINNGTTAFRGRVFRNTFPVFDTKKFDPDVNKNLRMDLLGSALYKNKFFYKGIPTEHNNAIIDRELLLRLNGGFDTNMTFSDLFLNSNYLLYKKSLVPLFKMYKKVYVIANFRAKLVDVLDGAIHVKVPDNFFPVYDQTLKATMATLGDIESGSLVLSSASSLSNVVAHKLFIERHDITFLDIGSSLNDLLSLGSGMREYMDTNSLLRSFFYKRSKRYNIKW